MTDLTRANMRLAKKAKAVRHVTPEPSRHGLPLALSGVAPWLKPKEVKA